jgi:hypothetical protein
MAVAAYPGGTSRDPSTIGYSPFQNFLSDLGMTVAFDGRPNRGGALLFVASLGILPMAAAGLIGAALAPADRFLDLHVACSRLAIAAAPVASVLFALAATLDRRFAVGVAVGWLLLALTVGVLFVARWGPGIGTDRGLTIQVTVQKIVTALVLIIGTYQTYHADRALDPRRRG